MTAVTWSLLFSPPTRFMQVSPHSEAEFWGLCFPPPTALSTLQSCLPSPRPQESTFLLSPSAWPEDTVFLIERLIAVKWLSIKPQVEQSLRVTGNPHSSLSTEWLVSTREQPLREEGIITVIKPCVLPIERLISNLCKHLLADPTSLLPC